ncbi:cytochrome P450 2C15-like [Physella acuta]|uniref:cytochrome P450 2C15-like n=1 Tax=Physella acuta TaxID=109671 RepID=UPI0027DB80FD|nr:cytochrome P450 2C15-like [Physella acuta]XP_059161783.1 cytochrome P450 2C15-like [Physella acuta]
MLDLTTFILASSIFLLTYFWLKRSRLNLPPYPTRPLPLLGHLLTLEENPRSQFKKWREELGDIFSLYMGNKLVVVVCGYDLIKELLLKRGEEFSDRPALAVDQATPFPQKGVIFSNGQNWKEQRTVALNILRDFGMGKNRLAEKIEEEIDHFLDLLAEQEGKPSDIKIVTNISIANVICSIVLGNRFNYQDENFQDMVTKLTAILTDSHFNGVTNFIPFLHLLPGDRFHIKKINQYIKSLCEFLFSFVNKKGVEELDENNVDSLISAYMLELKSKESKGVPTHLNKENLSRVVTDLFSAGTETTSTTILWCLLFVLNHPDVQKKIHGELQQQIGNNRKPCLQDKPKLVYLNAVIKETQRLASIVPQAITHTCPRDVTVRGYTIPKGTYISPNLDSVLHDPKIWGDDVMEFKPERFIDQDGKLKTPEEFIPFSIGRRVCLGESLAVMELFLYLSSIFHRFEILPATPGSPPPIKYKFGLTIAPLPYELKAVKRR